MYVLLRIAASFLSTDDAGEANHEVEGVTPHLSSEETHHGGGFGLLIAGHHKYCLADIMRG